jgi:plasmid stability protein
MRQLITRIDDSLHARLKARARDEGRSVNKLVAGILDEAVPVESPRERLRRRLRADGRLIELDVSPHAPRREEVVEMLRGEAGRAVLEAFEDDRKRR